MDNIRPIRNDADLAWALGEIEPYFDTDPASGTPAADPIDVLVALAEVLISFVVSRRGASCH